MDLNISYLNSKLGDLLKAVSALGMFAQ